MYEEFSKIRFSGKGRLYSFPFLVGTAYASEYKKIGRHVV